MRGMALVAVVVLAAALLVAVPAVGFDGAGEFASGSDEEAVNASAANTTDEVAPGERLSGAVGVGQAEFEGELDGRAFGIAMASAATEQGQADVVADRFEGLEERLAELEAQKEALEAQRDAGEITEGEYRARITRLAAQSNAVDEAANATAGAAGGLPAERLAERGVDAEQIANLSERASELSGGEVADIARGIAGGGPDAPPVGEPPGLDERPGNATDREPGPPDDAGGPPAGNDSPGEPGNGDER